MSVLRAGLIGAHISATRLPRALELLCQEAGWSLAFDLIDTSDMAGFDFAARVDAARADGWTGVTVTHPWKPQARAYAGGTMVGAAAASLGASTLLTFAPLAGHNTDFTGALAALPQRDLGRVLVIGAGGVSEALVPALKSLGARDIHVTDLDPAKAQDLATRCAVTATDDIEIARQMDGLINATPVGMGYHPGLPLAPALIGPQSWAFDAVYTPPDTAFLQAARAAGLNTISGFELYNHMAKGTFTAYTGIEIDEEAAVIRLDALRPD